MMRMVPAALMPMVVDQAVPSDVHSTVGSEWKESPVTSGSWVWLQEAPVLVEKKIACSPLPPMLLEAPMILLGEKGLMRIIDSLRGMTGLPEMFCSPVSEALFGDAPMPCEPGRRSWWVSIHS